MSLKEHLPFQPSPTNWKVTSYHKLYTDNKDDARRSGGISPMAFSSGGGAADLADVLD